MLFYMWVQNLELSLQVVDIYSLFQFLLVSVFWFFGVFLLYCYCVGVFCFWPSLFVFALKHQKAFFVRTGAWFHVEQTICFVRLVWFCWPAAFCWCLGPGLIKCYMALLRIWCCRRLEKKLVCLLFLFFLSRLAQGLL